MNSFKKNVSYIILQFSPQDLCVLLEKKRSPYYNISHLKNRLHSIYIGKCNINYDDICMIINTKKCSIIL